MTKYSMIKRFCKETGATKREATSMLRDCQWDYSKAKTLYYLPEAIKRLEEFISDTDWTAIMNSMVETMTKVVERVVEIIPKVVEDMPAIIETIQDEKESDKDGN